jgi:hypothetical protein
MDQTMKSAKPILFVLQASLALARFGWLNTVAIAMILVGALGGGWLHFYLENQVKEPLHALQQAEQSLKNTAAQPGTSTRSVLEERLTAFYDVMGDKHDAEQQIKTLFAVATKTGLTLNQAEYRTAFEKSSRITTYQIILPVRGNYAAIRHFCAQTLLAVPFASLDDISFKRDAISSSTLEARLRFTLYLSNGNAVAQAASQGNVAERTSQ